MKNLVGQLSVFLANFLVVGMCEAVIVSNFSDGADGWDVVDFDNAGAYSSPLAGSFAVTTVPLGGRSGAFIEFADETGEFFFFRAPSKFLTSWTPYLGESLSFSMQSTVSNLSSANEVVLHGFLAGGGAGVIVSELPSLPATTWTDYSIGLEPANFRYNNKAGSVVSEADFEAVLANVTAFYLPGEFGSVIAETVGLDEVLVGVIPEPSVSFILLASGLGLLPLRRRRI